jgi:hypothetical protein
MSSRRLRPFALVPLLLLLATGPALARAADAPAAPSGPAAQAAPEDGDGGNRTTGMVFGQGHLFTVQSPRGWAIQAKREETVGPATVFYPRDSSFADAPAVLYVNTAPRLRQEKLEDFVVRDVEGIRKESPGVKAEKGAPLVTADGKRAEVRFLTGDRFGNVESIAFVVEDALFVTIVLTARNPDAHRSALPAFEDLVRSYRFVTKDVKISK